MTKYFFEYRIENTNACGYRCQMCPREKQTRKIGFMSLKDFELVLSKLPLNQKAQVHLHGYGEPLLDKTLPEKIALISKKPQLSSFIISTLGVELEKAAFENLVDAGLKSLLISCYGSTPENYKAIHGTDKLELVKHNLRTLAQVCQAKNSPLIRVVKFAPQEVQTRLVQIGKPVEEHLAQEALIKEMETLGYEIQLAPSWHNYGNGRSYNQTNQRLCPVVGGNRSKILNITWDLDVIPCCFDFNATIKFGNLRTQSLAEIFSSDNYQHFLLAHLRQDLSHYPVCQTCEKMDYNQ
jgi:radical SAM protein with 4Fe4S-binding SPASM domain